MTWFTVRHDIIDAFKRSWPCHGLPDDFHSLSVETAQNGDLVDIEAYTHHPDGTDELLDWREFDGAAFTALVQDCILKGDITEESKASASSPPVSPTSPAPR
jgi:hypothetical protein